MRIFLFLTLSLMVWGCSTVEVTREVIKVTNTISEKVKKPVPQKEKGDEVILDHKDIGEEIEIIEEKRKKEKTIVESQQKLAEINFIGKTENKIFNLLGKAQLIRIDGSIYTLRYDSKNCRLFLFFNQESNNKKVKFFELRNTKAELLNSKNSLEKCYRELNLIN